MRDEIKQREGDKKNQKNKKKTELFSRKKKAKTKKKRKTKTKFFVRLSGKAFQAEEVPTQLFRTQSACVLLLLLFLDNFHRRGVAFVLCLETGGAVIAVAVVLVRGGGGEFCPLL